MFGFMALVSNVDIDELEYRATLRQADLSLCCLCALRPGEKAATNWLRRAVEATAARIPRVASDLQIVITIDTFL